MAKRAPIIAVIDDSATSISLYRLSVDPLGAELVTFHSALEALAWLESNAADLVFLDVLMREKDGLTILKKLRAMNAHRNTSVIMVTSKDYAQDRQVAKSLGAIDYLVKPLRSQEIRELIIKYTDAEPKAGIDATP